MRRMEYNYVLLTIAVFCLLIIGYNEYRDKPYIWKSTNSLKIKVATEFMTPKINSSNGKFTTRYPETSSHRPLSTGKIIQADSLKIEKCVPQYSMLNKQLKKKVGKPMGQRTALLLLASYEFSTHIIVTLNSEGWRGKPVFCRYLDSTFMELGEPVSSKVFSLSMIPCCRRKNAKYMAITLNKTQQIDQWTILNDRTEPEPKYNLSMCLEPIYGDESTWLLLAELIEHHKLQGVDHFYVYIKDMDVYSRYLVEDYVRSGEVEVVWMDYRNDSRRPKDWHYIGIEDCLERSRFHSKYVIFTDLDERITPSNKKETILDIVRSEFSKNIATGGIQFRPRWILRDKSVPKYFKGSSTLNESLPTLVFHNTSHWPPVYHTAKMILDPTKVVIMLIHNVTVYAPGYQTFQIEPKRAIIRHYRSLTSDNWGKKFLKTTQAFGEYKNTSYPAYLMNRLYENVLRRLTHVYSKTLPVS